jgi:hypothetical protein
MDGCVGGLILFALFLAFVLSLRKEKPTYDPPPLRVVDARSVDPGETCRAVLRTVDEVHGRWYEGRHADEIVYLRLPSRAEIQRHDSDVRGNLRWLEKEAGDTDVILHYEGEEPIRRVWDRVEYTESGIIRRAEWRRREADGCLPLVGMLLMMLVIVGVLFW